MLLSAASKLPIKIQFFNNAFITSYKLCSHHDDKRMCLNYTCDNRIIINIIVLCVISNK